MHGHPMRGTYKKDIRHGTGRSDGVKAHNHRKGTRKHSHAKRKAKGKRKR